MEIFTKKIFNIIIVCSIFTVNAYAKTCKSCVTFGNWNSASTWLPAGVPACGDSIVIQAGHTVSVTTQQNYSACGTAMKLAIYGDLKFFNGSKLRLPCGSYVIVFLGGKVEADVGLNNSNFIEICNVVEWNSSEVLNGVACIPENHPFCASVLPITLTYFKAEACNFNKICFKWGTASENNNNHYEIERSNDAVDFKNIFTLASKAPDGNSHYNISYFGTDEAPLNGINYYRLNQVDNNNTNTYSEIISVHSIFDEGLQFLIFPNCNSGTFTVQMKSLNKSGNLFILIRNSAGSVVYKAKYYVDDIFTEIKVAPEFDLEDGFYYCSFIINDKEHVIKFIVENKCR